MTPKDESLNILLESLDRRNSEILEEIRALRTANDGSHAEFVKALNAKANKTECEEKHRVFQTGLPVSSKLFEVLKILALAVLAMAAGGAGPEFLSLISKLVGTGG